MCARNPALRSLAILNLTSASQQTKPPYGAVFALVFLLFLGSPALAQVTLTPSSLSFGNFVVGQSSSGRAVTLNNNQTVPLTISQIATSGGNAPGDYALSTSCPLSPNTLRPGLHCNITVTFTPSALGSRTTSLTVTDDASNSPQSVALTGNGIAPVAVSPTSLGFGNQVEGTTSAAKTVMLKNAQIVPLTISGIAFSGSAPGDYAWGGNCPITPNTLGAGQSCSITVTLTPLGLGTRTASLMITDDASSSPQSVALTGTGTVPVSVSPTSLGFPSLVVGTTSAAKTISLINHLNTELFISSITTSGDFAVASNTCGPGIGAGLQCSVGVTFTPTALGSRVGTLTINDSAIGSPTLVALSGTGNDSGLTSITVTPASPSIATGTTQQFKATGHFRNGTTPDLTAFVTWNSSAQGVATITASGLATGVSAGTSSISAMMGSIAGSTTLTVTVPVLTSIAVTPSNPTIAAGLPMQFAATGTYSDGSMQNLTASVGWSSSSPGVATINAAGLAGSLTAGSTTITATSGAVQGSTTLTVTSALTSIAVTPANASIATGNTLQFTATGTYSDGSTQNLTSTATWSSSAPGVATVSNASGSQGLANAVAPGATTITAASGAVNGSTTLTVAGFVLSGNLNTARATQTATLLTNGMALVAGGVDGSGNILASAELYNATGGTFSPTGSLNTGRSYHSATLFSNGVVLMAGGVGFGAVALTSAELYNPTTGSFTNTGSLNNARSCHSATALNNGTVLIVGGLGSSGALASAELYNPATGTFTITGSLNTARSCHTATMLSNGMVLIAGGADSTGAALANAELYNPASGTFTSTGSLNTARTQHTATMLNNGMVLIAGGANSTGAAIGSAELYNPAASTFTSTGSLNTARADHTATLLNNGMVLLAGGTGSGAYLASAELYDPVAAIFTFTGALNNARYSQSAALLPSGMVLVAGGSGSGGVLASAELYSPATLTPPNLVSIAVAPSTSTLSPGVTQQFVATGTFGDSSTQQLASVSWNSSNRAVASITDDASDQGAAYAVAPGTATVSACAGSVCGSASLTVGEPPLVSIAVTPTNGTVQAGLSVQFDAMGTYADGSMQDVTTSVTWNSSVPSVATLTAGGLATTVTTGVLNITATMGTISGSTVLTVTTTAQMPTGTVSGVTSETCPAIVNGSPADWVTNTSGGTDTVALCYHATVSCPEMPDIGVTYGVATPPGTSAGTVVFVSAKGGMNTLPGEFKNEAPFDLFHFGFQTVQFAWDTAWQDGSSTGSLKLAACRDATFLDYAYTQYYQTNSNNSPTAGMCAHSQSGGAAGLAFAFTFYGAGDFIDKAVYVSGPHYADMVQGCSVPNAPPVSVCPSQNGVYPLGCNSLSGTWTNPPEYTGGAAQNLTQELADNPACNDPNHTYTPEDNANLTATSLIDGAADANYNYPHTAITAWECDDDYFWNNPSEGQGWLYFSQLRSPSQVAPGCNYSTKNTANPNACMTVNRVFGCTSLELAATGYVCNGSTCPVCTGNPPTNCTCGGVACSSVSQIYGMPTFREVEYEDPINGCIKRH